MESALKNNRMNVRVPRDDIGWRYRRNTISRRVEDQRRYDSELVSGDLGRAHVHNYYLGIVRPNGRLREARSGPLQGLSESRRSRRRIGSGWRISGIIGGLFRTVLGLPLSFSLVRSLLICTSIELHRRTLGRTIKIRRSSSISSRFSTLDKRVPFTSGFSLSRRDERKDREPFKRYGHAIGPRSSDGNSRQWRSPDLIPWRRLHRRSSFLKVSSM